MRTFKIVTSLILLAVSSSVSFSQEVNWRTINDSHKHIVSANFGADYSSYYGLSYGYYLGKGLAPFVVGTEFNVSFGDDVFDDWKSKTSIQAEVWHSENLSWGLKGGFIVRHLQSEIASLYNIGADVTTTFGYSTSVWGVSATVNYDHAISTHIKNDLLKEYYPEIRDGWYGATGGNFKFGIQANRSFGTWSGYFNIGKAFGKDFKDNPTLPFYLEISVQKRF